jgi:AcrR family transcriptional regulator
VTETIDTRTRARPLSPDDRRAAIIDAVTPLLMEHGRAVTTRQIADAAGIAEGTIFRAFPDKDAIILAAVEKFLDPSGINSRLRAIDPELALEAKVNEILIQLRGRMTGIFGMMQAAGMSGPPPRSPEAEDFVDVIADVLGPSLVELQVPSEQFASFMRLVAFASSIRHFNQGHEIATADLAHLITYGIAGAPAEAEGGSADAS